VYKGSELRLRAGAQPRLDNAVAGPHQGREFGPGVNVQLLVNIHQVRGDRPLADEKPVCDLAVGEPVDHIANDFALALTELFIKHGSELAVGNEVRDPGPVGLVLSLHELPELIARELIEQIDVVELPRVLDGHFDELFFVLSGKHLAAGWASEAQGRAALFLRHGGGASLHETEAFVIFSPFKPILASASAWVQQQEFTGRLAKVHAGSEEKQLAKEAQVFETQRDGVRGGMTGHSGVPQGVQGNPAEDGT
jgi:hypothetical protein